MPEALANLPELPPHAAHLWEYFTELSRKRVMGFNGPASLQFVDIEAWGRLKRVRLDPWELDAILTLDDLFLASLPKPKT